MWEFHPPSTHFNCNCWYWSFHTCIFMVKRTKKMGSAAIWLKSPLLSRSWHSIDESNSFLWLLHTCPCNSLIAAYHCVSSTDLNPASYPATSLMSGSWTRSCSTSSTWSSSMATMSPRCSSCLSPTRHGLGQSTTLLWQSLFWFYPTSSNAGQV